MSFEVCQTRLEDATGVAALQRLCFPEPFPEDLLWKAEHIAHHIALFHEGQFVVKHQGLVIGSTTNALIDEDHFQAHLPWEETIGGLHLTQHDPAGCTLYGVDISVHPDWRSKGIGRALYQARFDFVRNERLTRYATGCRVPGFREWLTQRSLAKSLEALNEYLSLVQMNQLNDRTLTPLLKMGVTLVRGQLDYMEDEESLNCAALLEWTP